MEKIKIILFGISDIGKQVFEYTKKIPIIDVVNFTDNNTEKYWCEFCCTLVIPLVEAIKSNYSIVICSGYSEQIAIQLDSYGFYNYYKNINEFLTDKKIDLKFMINKKYKQVYKEKIEDKIKSKVTTLLNNHFTSNGTRYYDGEFDSFFILCNDMELNSNVPIPFNTIQIENYKHNLKSGSNLIVFFKVGINYDIEKMMNVIKYNNNIKGNTILYYNEGLEYLKENITAILNILLYINILIVHNNDIYLYLKQKNLKCKLFLKNKVIDILKYNPIGFNNGKNLLDVVYNNDIKEKVIWNPEIKHELEDIFIGCIESTEYKEKVIAIFDSILKENKVYPKWDSFLDNYIYEKNENVSDDIIYLLSQWVVNIESKQWENLLYSDSILKLQGLGKLVLSNYNRFINFNFPNVFLINNNQEVPSILNKYPSDYLYEMSMFGVRNVMVDYNIFEEFQDLKKELGLPVREKKILIVLEESSSELLEMFYRQTYCYKNFIYLSKLNDIDIIKYDFITFFNINMEYGEFYIEDMINAFKYTNSDFVTKDAFYLDNKLICGKEHEFVNYYKGRYKTVFSTKVYTSILQLTNNGTGIGYSLDHLELRQYTVKEIKNQRSKQLKVSVIVPIYNNGKLLIGKCFNSLLRCNMFDQLEIILIDDGSTDFITTKIVERLQRRYENVKTYFFDKGGSGSPSRARNKGYQLANCNYVIALDPDDEVTYNGYKILYDTITKTKSDAVLGNVYRIDSNSKIEKHNYFESFKYRNNGITFTNNPLAFIQNSNFAWIGFCNFMIKKSVIISNKLCQEEGIIGEDYLFINELFLVCKKIKAIDVLIYYYYNSVNNSLTNSINSSFFKKKKEFVKATLRLFFKYGIEIKQYEQFYQDYFIEQFILPLQKLNSRSTDNELEDCIKEVYDVYLYYQNQYKYNFQDNDLIKTFLKLYEKKDNGILH